MKGLPFPWQDVDGLACLLRDPGIWALVFQEPDARKSIKRVAKHTLGGSYEAIGWGTSVSDNDVFGKLAASVMARRTGRSRLAAMFLKDFRETNIWASIAQRLFNSCVLGDNNWEDVGSIPSAKDVCRRENDKWYILPTKFEQWLVAHEPAVPDRRTLALFACAFAILQPDDAGRICNTLLNCHPAYADFLQDTPYNTRDVADSEKADRTSDMVDDAEVLAYDALKQRVAELRSETGELSAQLSKAADALRTGDMQPAVELINALNSCSQRFQALRNEVLKYTSQVDQTADRAFGEQMDLAGIEAALDHIETASRQHEDLRVMLEQATQVLDAIARLQRTTGTAEVEPIHKKAEALRERLGSADVASDREVKSVAKGDHPLSQLVHFVRDLRRLDDESWRKLRDLIAQEFGEDVVTGVVRGRITITESPAESQSKTEDTPTLPVQEPSPEEDLAKPELVTEPDSKAVHTSTGPSVKRNETPESVTTASSAPPHDDAEPATSAIEAGPTLDVEREATGLSEANRSTDRDAATPAETATGASEETQARIETTETLSLIESQEVISVAGPVGQADIEAVSDRGPAVKAAEASLAELATKVEQAQGADTVVAALHLMLGFVRDDQLCHANYLGAYIEAQACAGSYDVQPALIPAAVLRMLAISPHIGAAFGESSSVFSEAVTDLYEVLGGSTTTLLNATDVHLLALAATLRPALIGPTTDGVDVLQMVKLPTDFSVLSVLLDTIMEFSRFGCRVSPRLLKGLVEHDVWQTQLDELRNQAQEWLSHARQCTIIYAPTTSVWHNWLDEHGPLGVMLGSVINDQRNRASTTQQAMEHWRRPENVVDEMKHTDRELRGRKANLRPIEARALSALKKKVSEPLGFVGNWLALIAEEPEQVDNYVLSAIQKCRAGVHQHLGPISRALDSIALGRNITIGRRAALSALRRSISELRDLFDPSASDREIRPANEVLGAELLRIPGLHLDDDWKPRSSGNESLLLCLIRAAKAPVSWADAVDQHCDQENFRSAEAIIELGDIGAVDLPSANVLRTQCEERLQETRAAVQTARGALEKDTQRGVFDGTLSQSEFQALAARLEEVDPGTQTDFRPLRLQLDGIRDELRAARARHIEEVESRLTALRIQAVAPDMFKRIRSLLDDGDVRTAHEFLALHEQGQPLPADRQERSAQFFPEFIEKTEASFHRKQVVVCADTVKAIRNRKKIVNLDFSQMPPAQAKEAAEMIEAWMAACRGPENLRVRVAAVLRGMGFEDVTVEQTTEQRRGNHCWLRASARPIADRDVCVLPQFGSEAHGTYNILCLWGRPLEGDIVSLAASQERNIPTIALYFGQMSVRRRRDLAHRCRRDRRSLLLIDEYLLVFAAHKGERRDRLAAVLQSATQFTIAEPFTTTAGFVPSEMFYGRSEELRQLAAPNNSHLVYGGRQLGKTALLRHLERTQHAPESGRVVRWVDLTNQHGIGLNHPISDIWTVISRVLHEDSIVPRNVTTPDTIEKHVRKWLNADPNRQIVLLLDEADLFLESDSKGDDSHTRGSHVWVHTRRLKSLCENTGRRFKFVFAGLHNVQRSSRDPNSPIAHLGAAICIGPFIGPAEMREALEMIRRPFEALGYRFDSADLIMRILAYTNYYPSLIQLFCKHLLEYLTGERAPFNQRTSPPYTITAQDIEDAYHGRQLHKDIVERFNWTLRLDQRYRIVALWLAYIILTDMSETVLSDGLTLDDIRVGALSVWPKGFAEDASLDGFYTIVDEMIGLGVLREVEDSRFTFRSPNVVKMLGTDEQIFAALNQAGDDEPQIQYQASTFRRADASCGWRRSPLTAQQESALLTCDRQSQMSFVYGSPMAGIEDVVPFLQVLQSEASEVVVRDIQNVVTIDSFHRFVDEQLGESTEGVTLLVVAANCSWDQQWIAYAGERLNRLRGTRRLVNIVFLVNPSMAWGSMADSEPELIPRYGHVAVVEISLKPWSDEALRRLLDVVGVVDDAAKRKRILEVTGNWHLLIQELAHKCNKEPHRLDQHLSDIERSLTTKGRWFKAAALPSDVRPVLEVMAQYDDAISATDLETLESKLGNVPRIKRILNWADRLRYAEPTTTPGQWKLNPLLARILAC